MVYYNDIISNNIVIDVTERLIEQWYTPLWVAYTTALWSFHYNLFKLYKICSTKERLKTPICANVSKQAFLNVVLWSAQERDLGGYSKDVTAILFHGRYTIVCAPVVLVLLVLGRERCGFEAGHTLAMCRVNILGLLGDGIDVMRNPLSGHNFGTHRESFLASTERWKMKDENAGNFMLIVTSAIEGLQ